MGELIYGTIVDLYERNRVATRQVIADITGLKLSVVDDHIKRMKGDDRLRSPVNGVVEPVYQTQPDRAVSLTVVPNARIKLEIGDLVLDLSQREVRQIGSLTSGFCIQFGR